MLGHSQNASFLIEIDFHLGNVFVWAANQTCIRFQSGHVTMNEETFFISSTLVEVSFHFYMFVFPLRPKEPGSESTPKDPEVKRAKRALEDTDNTTDSLSKNKQKKKARNPNKNFCPEQKRKQMLSLS